MVYFIEQKFSVPYYYKIFFTKYVFNIKNEILVNIIKKDLILERKKLLVIIDNGVIKNDIINEIINYCNYYSKFIDLKENPIILKGGESIKNNFDINNYIYELINKNNICRHSFVIAVGGGSLLDSVGFSVATAHRGVRLIRIPTTVLSQNDSGVGVKNSINYFSKKNFIGTFSPPYSVINDSSFLLSLNDREWFGGISEAIKVGLIKDANFFYFIKNNIKNFINKDIEIMEKLIYRCAELHVNHISSADPFEFGSSRPLDFGHWAAHKLETLTKGRLSHGEAVAIGISLDVVYSYFSGFINIDIVNDIINVFLELKFLIYVPELDFEINDVGDSLIFGIKEFQEHLGGNLTIMMLKNIGEGFNVSYIDISLLLKSVKFLKNFKY
ncbi:MAG: 3-dehydroquinate synthase [Candidatus Azosocius agrarius]|nr:MAG: 3-dehydroquinate synthase [Gammaproteobacteria bacterium]